MHAKWIKIVHKGGENGRDELTQDEMDKIEENKMEENRFRKELSKLLAGDKVMASKPLVIGKTPFAIDCCLDQKGLDLVITDM